MLTSKNINIWGVLHKSKIRD